MDDREGFFIGEHMPKKVQQPAARHSVSVRAAVLPTKNSTLKKAPAAPRMKAAADTKTVTLVQKPYSHRHAIYDWIEAAIVSLVLVTLVFSFVFRIVGVDGQSMMKTLDDGDRLLLRSAFYTPKFGDIVVIYRTQDKEPLIKRVIGLPGDTIRLDVENNKVYRSINGGPEEALVEPYVHYPLQYGIQWLEPGQTSVTVPPGKIFVMGDHRDDSSDSRMNDIGLIDINHVMGKVIFRIYPFNKIGDPN